MIREAIQYCIGEGQRNTPVHVIHEDRVRMDVLVRGDSDEVRTYAKDTPPRTHVLDTVPALLDYISSAIKDGRSEASRVVVWIGERDIIADMAYGVQSELWSVRVPLQMSEEYAELTGAGKWAPHDDLVSCLRGPLWGSVDPGLALLLARVRVRNERVKEIDISESGLASNTAHAALKIVCPKTADAGQVENELPLFWEYSGPIYTCSTVGVTIQLRLDVRVSDGLMFRLVTLPPMTWKTTWREQIKEQIGVALGGCVGIYLGKPA